MDEQKPKVILADGNPHEVTFLSSLVSSGTGQYGKWYRFNVLEDGVEKSLFLTAVGYASLLSQVTPDANVTVTLQKGEGGQITVVGTKKPEGGGQAASKPVSQDAGERAEKMLSLLVETWDNLGQHFEDDVKALAFETIGKIIISAFIERR